MNLADKLRFLADRAEDGKAFNINRLRYRFNNGKLEVQGDRWLPSELLFDSVISCSNTLTLTTQWEFTEDEKVILRNLPEKYEWIARDEDGHLCVYAKKPIKGTNWWWLQVGHYHFNAYKHLFKSIKWSDKEPCEFRKYL